MRKKGVSPEFLQTTIPGSYNMLEQRVFFGSKMMDIEDEIIIDNRDIVYYQQIKGAQLDLNQELTFDPNVYSTVDDKEDNHLIGFDPSQSESDKENKTKWVVEINLRNVLKNYVYSQIKSKRSFENILSKNTIYKSVNESIYKYIDNNVMDRYEISSITFYVKYLKFLDENVLRFKTNYDSIIETESNVFTKTRTIYNEDKSFVKVLFSQEENSNESTFDYYFNLTFKKK